MVGGNLILHKKYWIHREIQSFRSPHSTLGTSRAVAAEHLQARSVFLTNALRILSRGSL